MDRWKERESFGRIKVGTLLSLHVSEKKQKVVFTVGTEGTDPLILSCLLYSVRYEIFPQLG